jgi:hypothetical protein
MISVKRPVFAIMMTAALIVLGAVSYESLGLDLMPKTDAPVVSVQANLPGASAEEIETQITKRIEEAVNTISGIDELRASSDQGNSRVTINFTLERDIESATQDVRDKLAQIVNQFPRDTRPLQITKMDPDAQPIFGFAVYGPRAPKELTEIAEKRVKQELETVRTSARSATTASASARSSCCSTPTASTPTASPSIRSATRSRARTSRFPAASSPPARRRRACGRWGGSRTSRTSTGSSSRTAPTGR